MNNKCGAGKTEKHRKKNSAQMFLHWMAKMSNSIVFIQYALFRIPNFSAVTFIQYVLPSFVSISMDRCSTLIYFNRIVIIN